MNVSAMNPDFRPAFAIISEIEKVSSKDELGSKLQALYGPYGDRLNWEEFWKLLEASPAKQVVLRDFTDLLLRLQSRDCSAPVFKAYSSFVISSKQGLDYLYDPDKRVCNFPLGSEQVLQVIRSAWEEEGKVDPKKAILLLGFFSREVSQGEKLSWVKVLGPNEESYLLPIFELAVTTGKGSAGSKFISAYRSVTGAYPFPQFLSLKLFDGQGDFWNEFLEENGLDHTLDFLLNTIADNEEVSLALRTNPLLAQNVTQSILNARLAEKRESIALVWNRYQKYKEVLLSLNFFQDRNFRIGLINESHDRLLHWAAEQSVYQIRSFTDQFLAYYPNNARNLDLLWIAYLLPPEVRQIESIRRRLRNIKADSLQPEDQVLLYRLKLRFAESNDRLAAKNKYCEVMERVGLQPLVLSASEFEDRIAKSYEFTSGCHEVLFDDAMSQQLELSQPVLGNRDSVFTFRKFKNLNFKAASVKAGVLAFEPSGAKPLLSLAIEQMWDKSIVISNQKNLEVNISPIRTFTLSKENKL